MLLEFFTIRFIVVVVAGFEQAFQFLVLKGKSWG